MNTFFVPFSKSSTFKRRYFLCLMTAWIFGLLIGWFSAFCIQPSLCATTDELVASFRAIPFKAWIVFLPFLLSAFAVYFSFPYMIPAISFAKAFLFAFCCYCLDYCFGACSWLVKLLLLFSDSCFIPFLFLFWLRGLSENSRFNFAAFLCLLLFCLIIVGIDCCVVTPYAVGLLSF